MIILVISFRVYSDFGIWFFLYINCYVLIFFLYYSMGYIFINVIFVSFNNLFVINYFIKIMSKYYKCLYK